MTRQEFAIALELLELTQDEAARLLGVHGARTVRRWLAGERNIPGSVEAALTAWLIRVSIPRATREGAPFLKTLEAAARKKNVTLDVPEPTPPPPSMGAAGDLVSK